MNKTTVKRGIGAAILALIAASLLAFLLKDKAVQRQDIVDMPLPSADNTNQFASDISKLPQLNLSSTGSTNLDGVVIASAGASNLTDDTAGAVENGLLSTTTSTDDVLDFNVRPPTTASSEFRDLSDIDVVNSDVNIRTANASNTTASSAQSFSASDTTGTVIASTVAASSTPSVRTSNTADTVIATTPSSTSPTRTARPSNTTRGTSPVSDDNGPVRLLNEQRTSSSASRNDVVASSKAATPQAATPTARQVAVPTRSAPTLSRTGYAIQLLATSSVSRAQDLVNVMKGEGYDAYFTKVTQNGKLLYRVRIGKYASTTSASKAHQAMKRRYKKNENVNSSAIVNR